MIGAPQGNLSVRASGTTATCGRSGDLLRREQPARVRHWCVASPRPDPRPTDTAWPAPA